MNNTNVGSPKTFDIDLLELFASIESRHFWFQTRARLVEGLARGLAAELPPVPRILEVGCGTGIMLEALRAACPGAILFGVDLFAQALALTRKRTPAHLVQADLRSLPFRDEFDMVGAFDVLEHLEDDVGALASLFSRTAPGGRLILTVPAHAYLWSYFDDANHHKRRYERVGLAGKLKSAGYEVEWLSEFMTSTLPLLWLKRTLTAVARRPADTAQSLAASELTITPWLNWVLTTVLKAEVFLLQRRIRSPMGSSLVAIARRPHRPAS